MLQNANKSRNFFFYEPLSGFEIENSDGRRRVKRSTSCVMHSSRDDNFPALFRLSRLSLMCASNYYGFKFRLETRLEFCDFNLQLATVGTICALQAIKWRKMSKYSIRKRIFYSFLLFYNVQDTHIVVSCRHLSGAKHMNYYTKHANE
jgi:hypothetical protein